jgi:riboflavin biosynthesis pyrimidine reductase
MALPSPMFESLYESPELPRFDLPEALRRIHGPFGLDEQVVFANFVSSLDGVVALPGIPKSSPLISGGHPADRFMVGLLRAAADAVVVGAGTYRAHKGPWTAKAGFPDAAASFAELRSKLGASPEPTFVVVTRSGDLGEPRPILRDALIVSSAASLERLERYASMGAEVLALDTEGSIDPRRMIEALRQRGHARILTEGGPDLMGDFLEAGVVDELFLSLSPLILGGGDPPPAGLAGAADFVSDPIRAERLLSVHRGGDYLFLRYALRRGS